MDEGDQERLEPETKIMDTTTQPQHWQDPKKAMEEQ